MTVALNGAAHHSSRGAAGLGLLYSERRRSGIDLLLSTRAAWYKRRATDDNDDTCRLRIRTRAYRLPSGDPRISLNKDADVRRIARNRERNALVYIENAAI